MALCLLLVIFIHLLPFYSQAKQKGIDSFKCVNTYQQPAFSHPKLKHHKLQVPASCLVYTIVGNNATRPNIPQFPGATFSRSDINNENGCPNGKVPIHANPSIRPLHDINSGVKYFATISTYPGERTYRGGAANMGVFNPVVEMMQSSRANIWVQNGPKSVSNSIEVGWAVHPYLYGDNHTRLTAYWTADDFQTTGCYNLLCPGFVQIDSSLFLGQAYLIDPDHPMLIEQIAILQVTGSSLENSLYKKCRGKAACHETSSQSPKAGSLDDVTGNWWLVTQMDFIITPVGYWPKEIFTYLALGADVVKYGGTTSTYLQQLDRPPMGSGNYPGEMGWVFGFFTRIRYVNESYNLIDAEHSNMNKVLDSVCYGLMYFTAGGTMKEAMKFGGPGGTAEKCKQLPPQQRN
ncbi:uncharacterized protein LOC111318439 [Durio zibethinus]|uniref:Uncharacterized protein LOC111318439 n=1 Tax=Durio zibethinus TaxID=66656 RepID=A0A6P6BIV4_DURZI|nr:uncharacterized protein LOC111318439 [Durio zibethinus]